MDTYNDSESDDDGLAVVVDGDDENHDIESDTEHAAGIVDPEGDEDVRVVPASGQAVSGGEEGLNSCLGRIFPRVVSGNGSLSSASCSDIATAVVLHGPGVIAAGREGHQWRDGH